VSDSYRWIVAVLYSVEMSDTRSVDMVNDVEVIELEGDGSRPSILVEPRPTLSDPEISQRTSFVGQDYCSPSQTSPLYVAGQLLRTKVLTDAETSSRHQSAGPYLATSVSGMLPLSTTGESLPSIPRLTSGRLPHYNINSTSTSFQVSSTSTDTNTQSWLKIK